MTKSSIIWSEAVADAEATTPIPIESALNVSTFGALGDGVNDDTAAIQAALDAVTRGGIVYMPAGIFKITAPLVVHPFTTLLGAHGNRTDNVQLYITIKPSADFVGDAAIRFKDKEEGSYSTENEGIRLENLTIDMVDVPGSTIDGIKASGYVHGVILDNVCVQHAPRRGFYCANYTRADASSVHPYSWNLWNCMAFQCGDAGFYFGNQQTDCTFWNCESLGCDGQGFYLVAASNTQLIGCRAEFCFTGFQISGSWGTSTGSGGAILTGCSTDRSTHNGVLIDSTGNAIHNINGLMTRRDGRNGNLGGGSYAGLNISSATTPVVVNSITCYPGVDDNGTGVNSPDYGVSVTGSTWVNITAGYLHAAIAGIRDGGTNTFFRRNPNVGTASGTTAAPTRDATTPWSTNGQGTIALASTDGIALNVSNTGTNINSALFEVNGVAAASRLLTSQVTGDTIRRFDLRVDGQMAWGSGSIDRDVTLYRSAVATLKTDGSFTVAGNVGIGDNPDTINKLKILSAVAGTTVKITRTTTSDTSPLQLLLGGEATSPNLQSSVSADAVNRWSLSAAGVMAWGDGTLARDTNLYRSAADTLKTDDSLVVGAGLEVTTALTHKGTTAGFFNTTPTTKPTAYTQTYATADKTHAAFTSADLTGIATSTTGSALIEPGAAYVQAEMQQNFRRIQDQNNALRADVADLKQLVNSLIDDMQALGLVG